jgi:predicted Zn-dependent protease with MMP-like domain
MKIKRSEFDRMLEAAIAALPPQFAKWIDEVPIVVEDDPSPELLEEMGVDGEGDLLGSYHGVALTQRSVEDSARLPDQILIFREPLISMCESREELAMEIRKTLLHELGHYAGLDEDDLENLGYG